ncbi:MAG: hydroxymethylglutaryl-CoA lyase [Acidobacteria bacterium]|nr:hydroxymethylglutaryl-CoA lyase [Acidobacteriota bacterium]
MRLPAQVTVVDVAPRDGLQNERARTTTAQKVTLVNLLSEAGVPVIEAGAFVSLKWVPQMADTAGVMALIERRPGTRYPVLVPNLRGLERALAAGSRDIAVLAASSETFSRRNINQSIEESFVTIAAVCGRANQAGVSVRGYLSTCFGCPYEGEVSPERVGELARDLFALGVSEVAISDTIGVAHPGQVWQVLDAVAKHASLSTIALHFHDTRGTALANVLAGLQADVTTYYASCGGLGGCPYAPGASGNLATEDLVYMLNGLGIDTGIDLDRLLAASTFASTRIDHPLPSRYFQASRAVRR